jgi:type II restriction enzyme
MQRLASDTTPNLVLMTYDLARFAVTDLFFVPKQFFTPAIIEARPPLRDTARRAGWVGSKIVLRDVPESGKVWCVKGGEALPRDAVLEQWRSTLFLRGAGLAARGWLSPPLRSGRSSRETPSNWRFHTAALRATVAPH